MKNRKTGHAECQRKTMTICQMLPLSKNLTIIALCKDKRIWNHKERKGTFQRSCSPETAVNTFCLKTSSSHQQRGVAEL